MEWKKKLNELINGIKNSYIYIYINFLYLFFFTPLCLCVCVNTRTNQRHYVEIKLNNVSPTVLCVCVLAFFCQHSTFLLSSTPASSLGGSCEKRYITNDLIRLSSGCSLKTQRRKNSIASVTKVCVELRFDS